jgi:hypothetical protein
LGIWVNVFFSEWEWARVIGNSAANHQTKPDIGRFFDLFFYFERQEPEHWMGKKQSGRENFRNGLAAGPKTHSLTGWYKKEDGRP